MTFEMRPLACDPKRLRGLSEKLIRCRPRFLRGIAVALVGACIAAHAAEPSPRAIPIPAWFEETFLDFAADVKEAKAAGKRLLVYFGQDGCPYCKRLMEVNFSQKDIVDKTRAHFVPIALNIWGDRDTVWVDGTARSEKELAAYLKVQFTPTLLFLDEKGNVVLRVNGYYAPDKFSAALDYVSGRIESKMSFAEYLRKNARVTAGADLNPHPLFMKPPYNLTRSERGSRRPLAVFFEQPSCATCDEMHATVLNLPDTLELMRRFEVVRLDLFGTTRLTTPEGKQRSAAEWGNALNIAYTPSVVLFDRNGREALRIEGYVRKMHLQSALDYVASGAYLREPSFQRYIQMRAEALRRQGKDATIW